MVCAAPAAGLFHDRRSWNPPWTAHRRPASRRWPFVDLEAPIRKSTPQPDDPPSCKLPRTGGGSVPSGRAQLLSPGGHVFRPGVRPDQKADW